MAQSADRFPVQTTKPESVVSTTGVDLRDWFAGQALVGLIPSPARPGVIHLTISEMASMAYAYADEMLKARAA